MSSATKIQSVFFELWREACQHIELEESAETISKRIKSILPFDKLIIRRLDPESSSLVSEVNVPDDEVESERKTSLRREELDQLLRWARSDRVLQRGKRLTGKLGLLLPHTINGDIMAIPLSHSDVSGCLLLTALPDRSFEEEHIELGQKLAEPISVALSNHVRVHEMAALRDAAEADKGALLRRLGRTDLGDVIIGEGAGLKQVMERVDLVATSDAPVMILGETGSGKEIIARALHVRGPRSKGPFIRVNCGAIPSELIDSQLFGHEKGSFTGAEQTRQGWFERANGGTLFLDEIGELPLDAQVRFLRVLQDGFVERVGSDSPVHVDVRVVAATHRDLAKMVSEGRFREDLWYRIVVFPILLPPLRERRGDIPEFAGYFAERAANRFGLPAVAPTSSDIDLLQSYHWPGNIRELGAVMDRAVILGNGKRLEIATALGLGLPSAPQPQPHQVDQSTPKGTELVPTSAIASPPHDQLALDEVIKWHICRILKQTRGKVEGPGGAAQLLKVNPHTLRAKMRKLKVQWNSFRKTDLAD